MTPTIHYIINALNKYDFKVENTHLRNKGNDEEFYWGQHVSHFLTSTAFAEDIVGTWRYIDDKTGEAKGLC